MDIKTMPALQGFAVGDTVAVKPRMGGGYNKPGGVAKVVSLRRVESSCGGVGNTMYTVRYLVGGGGEKDLPATLLSLHSGIISPRSSSSSLSTITADSSSEARRMTDLQLEMDMKVSKMEQQIEAERWQAGQDRKRATTFQKKMKALANDLSASAEATKAASKMGEQCKLQRQIDLERIHASIQDMMDAAGAAAAREASASLALKSKEFQRKLRQEEKARKHAESAAEAASNKAAADSASILANVNRLLDEAKQAADVEHEASRQEQERKITSLQEMLEHSQQPASSLAGAATKLGVQPEKRLTPNTGAAASSLEGMGRRDRASVERAAVSSIFKVLEMASPRGDPVDAARSICNNRKFLGLLEAASISAPESAEQRQLRQLKQHLAVAVRIASERKDADEVRHLLSLFPLSMSASNIAATCSSPSKPFMPGDIVRIISSLRFQGEQCPHLLTP